MYHIQEHTYQISSSKNESFSEISSQSESTLPLENSNFPSKSNIPTTQTTVPTRNQTVFPTIIPITIRTTSSILSNIITTKTAITPTTIPNIIETTIATNTPINITTNISTTIPTRIPKNIQTNISTTIQTNIPTTFPANVQTTIPTNLSNIIPTTIFNQNTAFVITPTNSSAFDKYNIPTISSSIPNSTNQTPETTIPLPNKTTPLDNADIIKDNNAKPSTIIEGISNDHLINKTEQENYLYKKESDGGLKPGVIAAIVVACIAGVLSCICIFFFIFYKGVKLEVSSESTIQTLKNVEIN